MFFFVFKCTHKVIKENERQKNVKKKKNKKKFAFYNNKNIFV